MAGLRDMVKYVPFVQRMKWKLEFMLWKKGIDNSHSTKYDPYRTYWVSTDSIRYSVIPSHIGKDGGGLSKTIEQLGTVEAGDWDKDLMPFEELDVYQAFKACLVEGKAWPATELYKRVVRDIDQGKTRWSCKSIDDLDKRFAGFEVLFDEIKQNGFKTQEELGAETPHGMNDEILVHIGREGDFIFAEGRHRLSLAKLAGIEKVPVKIARRHEDWVRFREEILAYANSRNASTVGHVYHKLFHPDLEDIPAGHGSKRLDLLKEYIKQSEGRLLDIGSNWGYFSNAFEKMGFDCIAVEVHPRESYFLKKLKRAENMKFQVVEKSIFDLDIDMNFEVVLAMNIFHHFLKEEDMYNKLVTFLENLNTSVMYFQPHMHDEGQMQGAYRNLTEDEFVGFIQEKARLKSAEKIGKDDDGRSIYVLRKA